jgi:hypothetical protein
MSGLLRRLQNKAKQLAQIPETLEQLRTAIGRVERRQVLENTNRLEDSGFRVFSQFDEDGQIQFVIHRTRIRNKVFVEFGVEDYKESNTRFLLQNDNWSGLVIDGSREKVDRITTGPLYWRHNLKAHCAFITAENIDQIIFDQGLRGEIGLLSIDVDGNDYWIWNAIKCIDPQIVVCEYNSLLGPHATLSVPYAPDFVTSHAHYSHLYFGASLSALTYLAKKKGYRLIGSNTNGCNAYFVRDDDLCQIPEVSVGTAYQKAQFRSARNERAELSYVDFDERVKLIRDLPFVDVVTGNNLSLREALKLPGAGV